METETLLTVQEAAALLGVHDNAVRIATKEGRLPFVTALGRKAIRRADLETYRIRTRPDGEKPMGRPKKQPENNPEKVSVE